MSPGPLHRCCSRPTLSVACHTLWGQAEAMQCLLFAFSVWNPSTDSISLYTTSVRCMRYAKPIHPVQFPSTCIHPLWWLDSLDPQNLRSASITVLGSFYPIYLLVRGGHHPPNQGASRIKDLPVGKVLSRDFRFMLPSSCQGSVRRLEVIRYILPRQGKVLRGTAPDVPINLCWIWIGGMTYRHPHPAAGRTRDSARCRCVWSGSNHHTTWPAQAVL